ncbi:VCBS repeat-containing protein [Knoellia locipacati]|uniref:FG-GAP repeat domain-containing protein n=1 Tax=Knoellia locipacati TaxID=882824 RepID=UPI0038508C9B
MRASLGRVICVLATLLMALALPAPNASAEPTYRLTAITVDGAVTSTTSATLHYALSGSLPTRLDAELIDEVTGAVRKVRVDGPGASGSATIGWHASWPAGTYRLQRVMLSTSGTAGTETWGKDGRVRRGIVEVGSHDLDFAAAAFGLSGPQTGELAPPRLLSARLLGDPSVAGNVDVEITTADEQPQLPVVSISWGMGIGTSGPATPVPTGVGTVRATAIAGSHELESITIYDANMLPSTYLRDGTVRLGGSGWTPPEKHTIDFAALDLSLVPKAPTANHTVRALPHGAELGIYPDDRPHVTEWLLTASPGGSVARVPATTDAEWRWAQVTGLTPGVKHTISLTAVGEAGPSAPTPLVTVTPAMTTNIFGVPRYLTSRMVVQALVASHLRPDQGVVRQYSVSGGAFRGTSIAGTDAARIASGGNITRTGSPSVLRVDGDILRHASDPSGPALATGFAGARWVDGGADLTGDGHTDVFAVDAAGRFRLYPGTGPSRLGTPVTIGSGWGGFLAVFTPGDFDGDRRADVLAVDTSGAMWLYRGNGARGWLGRVKVGSGWHTFAGVNAARDFNGDGREDVLAVTRDGRMILYPGTGRGAWGTARQIGSGWQLYY